MKTYAGLCVGGPWKGQRKVSPDQVMLVAQMSLPPQHRPLPSSIRADTPIEMMEIRRGTYEFDAQAGVWWWQGWGPGCDMRNS